MLSKVGKDMVNDALMFVSVRAFLSVILHSSKFTYLSVVRTLLINLL